MYDKCSDCEYTNYDNLVQIMETQQKKFIEYLEQKEEMYDIGANAEMAGAINGILQKYREIIGENDV